MPENCNLWNKLWSHQPTNSRFHEMSEIFLVVSAWALKRVIFCLTQLNSLLTVGIKVRHFFHGHEFWHERFRKTVWMELTFLIGKCGKGWFLRSLERFIWPFLGEQRCFISCRRQCASNYCRAGTLFLKKYQVHYHLLAKIFFSAT